jgi:hypothetical protein
MCKSIDVRSVFLFIVCFMLALVSLRINHYTVTGSQVLLIVHERAK